MRHTLLAALLCFPLACSDTARKTGGRGSGGGAGGTGWTNGGGDDGKPNTGGTAGEEVVPLDAVPADLAGCGVQLATGELPLELAGSTNGSQHRFDASCGSDKDSPDIAFLWQAPGPGTYLLSTEGSDFDTVLTIRTPSCEGEELRCNDDIGEENQRSQVVVPVQTPKPWLITVEGYEAEDMGTVRLTISRFEAHCEDGIDDDEDGSADCEDPDCSQAPNCRDIPCPAQRIENVPGRADGRTRRNDTSLLGMAMCGGGGDRAADATYGFTAPWTGKFTFSTAGSDFDTILYLRSASCTGEELGCDDDGGGRGTSSLTVDLTAGQEVVAVVDGYGSGRGSFVITVSGVETVCDDGIDDDGDGDIDCDDADCRSVECTTGGSWDTDWAEMEDETLVEVNKYRAAGATCDQEWFDPAPPLEMNELCRLAARLHSLDMGNQNYFEHEGLDGRSPFDRMSDAGYRGPDPWGENIAAGQRTAVEAVAGWMDSPGHCRNIMNPQYRVLGAGYAHVGGSDFGHYWTHTFGGGH